MTFTIQTTTQSIVLLDTSAYDDVPLKQVWLRKYQHSSKYCRNNHAVGMRPCCDLELANQFFHMTLELRMMNHHAIFGHKRFRRSYDIVGTNILRHLNLCVTLNLNSANQPFHRSLLLVVVNRLTKVIARRTAVQELLSKQSYFNINISHHNDLDLGNTKTIFGMTVWRIMVYHHTPLVPRV